MGIPGTEKVGSGAAQLSLNSLALKTIFNYFIALVRKIINKCEYLINSYRIHSAVLICSTE